MILYHYTEPANMMKIAMEGLQARATEQHAIMTDGIPVVWLTREPTNRLTARDLAELKVKCPENQREVGDFYFGGPARLTVRIERHNKKLIRYSDFLARAGGVEILKLLTPTARTQWYIYLGDISPTKIDTSLPASQMLDCLDHHISTHPTPEARAEYSELRRYVATLPFNATVSFSIQETGECAA